MTLVSTMLLVRLGIDREIQSPVTMLVDAKEVAHVVALVVFVVVIAPLTEEVLFRGIIQGVLRRWLGGWPASLLTAVLFAAVHTNAHAAVPLFVLGLILSRIYERHRSLVVPIAAHAAFNAISAIALLLLRT